MQADLESSPPQVRQQCLVDGIVLGHEIKRRPETQPFFEVRHGSNECRAAPVLHIMGEYQRIVVTIGPETYVGYGVDAPTTADAGSAGIEISHVAILNRPSQREALLLFASETLAKQDSEGMGHKRPHVVIEPSGRTESP